MVFYITTFRMIYLMKLIMFFHVFQPQTIFKKNSDFVRHNIEYSWLPNKEDQINGYS